MQRFLIALSLPLLFCVLVAVFYRPSNTYLNQVIIEAIGRDFSTTQVWWQQHLPLPNFMVYSLPGGLWVLVLSLLGWRLELFGFHLFYLGLLFGLGFEFFQVGKITDGTFDFLDVVAVLLCFSLAVCCVRFWLPRAWRAEQGYWRYFLFFIVFFAAFGADVLG